jgi:hypothetical protein
MAAYVSICDSPDCRISIEGRLQSCPQCGRPMRHRRQAQPRGCILLFVGLFLTLMMASVTFYLVPLMLRPGEEMDGTSFEGTAVQALFVLALFALLIGFGLTAMLGGLYEIATGKQHPHFLRWMLLFFALVLAGGLLVQVALSL